MRYIPSFLLALVLVGAPMSLVYAHGASETDSMMGDSTMGSDSWMENMMQFEDELVGDDDLHEQMEEYMDALVSGELSDEQGEQMLEWMQSNEYQAAMMSMMMRSVADHDGDVDWSDMHEEMMGEWGGANAPVVHWISIILIWAFLLTGIAAFWKIATAKKK